MNGNSDESIVPIAMGSFITFASIVVATASAMFERILQNAVEAICKAVDCQPGDLLEYKE